MERRTATLIDPRLLLRALVQSLRKLNPVSLWRNPVMLAVELGAIVTPAYLGIDAARGIGVGFVLQVSDTLTPPAWTNALSAGTNPVSIPATLPARFYRLNRPYMEFRPLPASR